MRNSSIRYVVLIALMFGLCSWGEKAHRKINSASVEFFPRDIRHLKSWFPVLADHASDADQRKHDDKNEFVKHFIDIDNYDDFVQNRRIEENFENACTKYGKARVMKDGTLPWVTDSTYKALVASFKSGSWDQAALTAADLGHYVGDGFMPLHITANYDGQLSLQKGIHRRYEETMIDQHIEGVRLKVSEIRRIKDVPSYIFKYLYANNSYVGLLLQADSRAYELSSNKYDEVYYSSLWSKTDLLTTRLLEESAKTLASLIYTAWLEAGSPKIPVESVKQKRAKKK